MHEVEQTADGAENAPRWLRQAVAGVWRPRDWARWQQRVLPEFEARGVSVDMLRPLQDVTGELVGIGVDAPGAGWCVGRLGQPRHGRSAVLHAASELLRNLEAPDAPTRRGAGAYGGWLRGR